MTSVDLDRLPYRRGVGIMLLNDAGDVLVGQRVDMPSEAWQMPQGGIMDGETEWAAALRELEEETSVTSAELLSEASRWFTYDLPEELVGVALKGRYRGQRQKWFAMRFTGTDREIDISARGRKAEFDDWRWVDAVELPDLVVPFKRQIYCDVVREFAPLITGILVAGRSGSALAARLGTMTISSEIDALRVMGVNPVRYLVVPSLLALLVMLPCLVLWSELVALAAAGVYVTSELSTTFGAYATEVNRAVTRGDILHGLSKSAIFAALIALVGSVDGAGAKGGAEGVGRVTTNAVVHGISAIVFTDMLFVFATTR